MTGPEHFREAAAELGPDGGCEYGCPHAGCDHEMAHTARAQAHATLALVAAVVARGAMGPADRHEWQQAVEPEYAAECAAEVAR